MLNIPVWVLRIVFSLTCGSVLFLALMPRQAVGAGSDIVNHVFAFSVLGVLARLSWPNVRTLHIYLVLLLLAAAIEVMQHFVGRDASVRDMIADGAGLLLSMLLMTAFVGQKNAPKRG
ncbi:MAG: VanZ family protein [Moraxellaceae bacterium]|nr:VanZ family protein [Moraxellaceae bacterium]